MAAGACKTQKSRLRLQDWKELAAPIQTVSPTPCPAAAKTLVAHMQLWYSPLKTQQWTQASYHNIFALSEWNKQTKKETQQHTNNNKKDKV